MTTVTTDGAFGLVRAVEAVFPARCASAVCHRVANVRVKLPDEKVAEVTAHLDAPSDAPSLDAARAAADRFANAYQDRFPAAVARVEEDREALFAIHRVPVRHRIRVRTTNLAERSF